MAIERTGLSVSKARIVVECAVLLVGWLLGGPVFLVTFLYTFIMSPIFQFSLRLFTGPKNELCAATPELKDVKGKTL